MPFIIIYLPECCLPELESHLSSRSITPNLLKLLRDNNDIIYSLRDWKFKGPDSYGVKYLKESTKTRIITECKARASLNSDVKDFIDWYNDIHTQL